MTSAIANPTPMTPRVNIRFSGSLGGRCASDLDVDRLLHPPHAEQRPADRTEQQEHADRMLEERAHVATAAGVDEPGQAGATAHDNNGATLHLTGEPRGSPSPTPLRGRPGSTFGSPGLLYVAAHLISMSIVFFIHQMPNSVQPIAPNSRNLPIVCSKSGSM